MSSATAIVILVVVLVVAGLGSFFIFNSQGTSTACVPATAPGCASAANLHDVTVLAPFTVAQTGQPIPFTAQLPEVSGSYAMDFGDGTNATSSTATFTHTYAYPGTYIISTKALVRSSWHDNLLALLVVTINPSFTGDINGTLPGIRGTTVSNSTSTVSPTGVLAAGGKLEVQGVYTGNASATGWAYIPPTITASCGTSCVTSNTVTVNGQPGAHATVNFGTAGVYTVTYNAGSQSGTSKVSQNYVWTAYVSSPSGVPAGVVSTKSPHPGHVIIYENAPGGATTLDPAVAYDSVSYEPIMAVYQPLITYNGSSVGPSPNDFIPVIASCVPGTAACTSLFGNTLQSGSDWTFVISAAPKFYDPGHPSASWGVYPSDVVFSMARSMALASPILGATAGWIQAQALLSGPKSASFDSGFHYPFNNTPYNILSSMTINGTSCPSIALSNAALYHGCVTFHANGTGAYNKGSLGWANFLDYMTIQSTGSIMSCGWMTANGAGLPGWTTGVTGAGDMSCAAPPAPGTATSPTIADTAWDFYPVDFIFTNYPCGNAPVSCGAMVGSGPYYLSSYVVSTSFVLKQNPNYAPNPNCSWTYVEGVNACYPAAGTYAKEIDVTWESDPALTAGLQGVSAGVVDFAAYHPSTETALALQFVEQHKATVTVGPSLSVNFWPFNFAFNTTLAAGYATGPITVPSDWFSNVGIRQLFADSYSYATVQKSLNTVDGIQYGVNYGGIIPHFMSDYYPTNISWPGADPVKDYTSKLSPSYWWAALTTPSFAGGAYYSAVAAACTPANPCQIPLFLQTGAPALDQAGALLAQNVFTYTNKSVVVHTLDINFNVLVANSLSSGAYGNPMPFYRLGWAADYAAADDYWLPMYYPNSTYTASDTDWQQTHVSPYNHAYCSLNPQTYLNDVNNSCQGAAYDAANALFIASYTAPTHAAAVLDYNLGEHIINGLALYIYTYQEDNWWLEAPWINVGSIDQQVSIAGGQALAFWWLNGNGVVSG